MNTADEIHIMVDSSNCYMPKAALLWTPWCSWQYHVSGITESNYCGRKWQCLMSVTSNGGLCGLVVKSSWLQIRRPRFDSRYYKKNVVRLERGPPSLVSKTVELLARNISGFGIEIREYGRGDALR
jgi:hypothetical protein